MKDILVIITEHAGELSIIRILLYYAVVNLAFTTLLVAGLFLTRKNPVMLKRYNAFLDRLFETALPQVAKKDEMAKVPEYGEQPGKEEEKEEHPDGITRFYLNVGDSYHCRLSAIERGANIGEMVWSVENEFVGKIAEKEIFVARMAGTTRIFCARKDDDFDTGATVYEINVRPAGERWFADVMIKGIINKAVKGTLLPSLMDRTIVEDVPAAGIMTFEGKNDEKCIKIQYGQKGEVQRVLYVISPSKDAESAIADRLRHRMRELKTNGGIRLWIHQFIDESRNEMDAYAFMKYSSEGLLLFGIGRSWRENGDTEEFMDNAVMAERMFAELLGDETPTDVTVTEDKKKFFNEQRSNKKKDNKDNDDNKDDKKIEKSGMAPEDKDKKENKEYVQDAVASDGNLKEDSTGESDVLTRKEDHENVNEEPDTVDFPDELPTDINAFDDYEENF